ncbi:MAG: hypothetical protein U0132_12230 [Gemmatimonadaceae bacterium]
MLVRMHSKCLTGDVFHSKRCDCGWQLHAAMEMIAREDVESWCTWIKKEPTSAC